MKVESKVDVTFQPVSITITLETIQELKALRKIAGYDVSIPSALRGLHINADLLSSLLEGIHRETDKYIRDNDED